MRIGIGTTVLTKGFKKNHLDGIGVYTKHLLKHLKMVNSDLVEVDFSKNTLPFSVNIGLSSVTSLPFYNSKNLEKKIDLFHATDHHIPKLKVIPVVATVMDIIPLVHPEWVSNNMRFFKNYAFNKSIEWAEHLITISEYSKNDLVQHLNINPAKISVISLGVNKKFFHNNSNTTILAVQAQYGINRPYFIYVGTIQPRKNLHRIIEAYLSLPGVMQKETSLVIVGKYGWGDEMMANRLEMLTHRTDNNIMWLNNIEDDNLVVLMQGAISMIYPSLYEGFGLPILEAFAAGVPVISSNTTSIPEVASDAAYLVDPYSINDISEAMFKMWSDSELRNHYIKKGNMRVLEYSWEKCTMEHEIIYKKILQL